MRDDDGSRMTSRSGPPSALAALFQEGLKHHQAGEFPKAERLYREILGQSPDHPQTLQLMGLVEVQKGRTDQALELLLRAVALKPDFAVASYNLGNLYRHRGELDSAVSWFQRAVEAQPEYPTALVNLGVTLRELGRLDEAVQAYGTALAQRPRYPEATYNLGVALQAGGRLTEAVDAYRQTLQLSPNHADALSNLGAALRALGRWDEAIFSYETLAAQVPQSAEAQSCLGLCLFETGRYAEAIAAHRQAVRLAPDRADAHVSLGTALLETGQSQAAIDAYQRGVELDPRSSINRVNLAIALQETGLTEAARTAADQAVELDPSSPAAWMIRADLKTFRAGDPDIGQLSSLVQRAGEGEARVQLEFALGKALMDVGEFKDAFAHLSTANSIKRSALRYSVQADLDYFEHLRSSFPLSAFKGKGAGALTREITSDRFIFIVGMPRSGSTLIEQILASHPDVVGGGELIYLEEGVRACVSKVDGADRQRPDMSDLDGAKLELMSNHYLSRLQAASITGMRVTDKMLSNFRFTGLIHLLFPGARIIHVKRDPLDTCFSCFSHNFSRGQAFTYDLAELGQYYQGYQKLMSYWREALPEHVMLEVVYETLVQDLEETARRMIAFVGLEWDDACLTFYNNSRQVRTASVNQVRKPIYASSIERWRPYSSQLQLLIKNLGFNPSESGRGL